MQFVAKKIQIRGREKSTNDFWHVKRTMVTGGNGFLGKHLVRDLRENGIRADMIRTDAWE